MHITEDPFCSKAQREFFSWLDEKAMNDKITQSTLKYLKEAFILQLSNTTNYSELKEKQRTFSELIDKNESIGIEIVTKIEEVCKILQPAPSSAPPPDTHSLIVQQKSDIPIDTVESTFAGATPLYGKGIINPNATACYINSVLQALRFSPSFRKFLSSDRAQSILAKELAHIYTQLESGQAVNSIQAFRKHALNIGWPQPQDRDGDPLATQQDAAPFCQFLLSTLGIPNFNYSTQVHYELPIPVRSLDLQRSEGNFLSLSISKNGSDAKVADLVVEYECSEEIEKRAIVTADGGMHTVDDARFIEGMPEKQQIPTLQKIVLEEATKPSLLPLVLKRYDERGTKIHTPIAPSQFIDFPLKDHTSKLARYELIAVVVHQGHSTQGGHYYCYVPKYVCEQELWIEYNDTRVKLHQIPVVPVADMKKNGYLHIYEFQEFVDCAGKPF